MISTDEDVIDLLRYIKPLCGYATEVQEAIDYMENKNICRWVKSSKCSYTGGEDMK